MGVGQNQLCHCTAQIGCSRLSEKHESLLQLWRKSSGGGG
jgi:hypothetical protein